MDDTPDFTHFGMRATPDAPDFAHKTAKPLALSRLSQGKPAFSNSTNSLFINETPSAPDCKELTRSAAKALASLIGDKVDGAGRGGLFDERSHGLTAVPAAAAVPSVEEIYRFVRTMYKRTRMQPECVVMVVHYIEKLLRLNAAEVALTAFTWRRLLIAALIVADKVFEDYAVWNADFVSMFPRSDIGDINALEREFLNRIQFGTSVGAGEYAKYYFALRELSEHKDALPAKPLTDAQAKRLETASQQLQDKTAAPKNAKEALPGSFGRSVSLSHFTPDGNFAAPGSSSEN